MPYLEKMFLCFYRTVQMLSYRVNLLAVLMIIEFWRHRILAQTILNAVYWLERNMLCTSVSLRFGNKQKVFSKFFSRWKLKEYSTNDKKNQIKTNVCSQIIQNFQTLTQISCYIKIWSTAWLEVIRLGTVLPIVYLFTTYITKHELRATCVSRILWI